MFWLILTQEGVMFWLILFLILFWTFVWEIYFFFLYCCPVFEYMYTCIFFFYLGQFCHECLEHDLLKVLTLTRFLKDCFLGAWLSILKNNNFWYGQCQDHDLLEHGPQVHHHHHVPLQGQHPLSMLGNVGSAQKDVFLNKVWNNFWENTFRESHKFSRHYLLNIID